MATALAALALVLAAVLAARPVAARLLASGGFGRLGGLGAGREARLGLVAVLVLDTRRRLLLLRCDDREVLVLAGPSDVVIGWLDKS